jgi:hypothetical protein
MENIVLYTKTYSGDLDRVNKLIESVKKYNKDNLSYYISVPKSEFKLFQTNIDSNYVTIITDEEIIETNEINGWKSQQIIKSNFWKLNLCKNYVCIDSDSEFIKPFSTDDFMFDEETPYTVIHEHKEFFEWCDTSDLTFDPKHSFMSDRQRIMDLFDRTGVYLDFGPSPVIWSSKVWKSLENSYIKSNNLEFKSLIDYVPSEFSWYGEFLLFDNTIKIIPRGPLFKVFHYKQQYDEFIKKSNIENLSKHYMGVVIQSNWKQ